MKQAILLTTLLSLLVCSHAQLRSTDKVKSSTTTASNYAVTDQILVAQLAQIMTATGLHTDFILKQAKVRNIEASISKRKRYILYNADFLNRVNANMRSQWGSIALLAHEVGHHLNGHTIRKSGSTPAIELEADEFAGYILQKLGATLEQSQAVVKFISSVKGSKSHPGRHDREEAIKTGWLKAGASAVKLTTDTEKSLDVEPAPGAGN